MQNSNVSSNSNLRTFLLMFASIGGLAILVFLMYTGKGCKEIGGCPVMVNPSEPQQGTINSPSTIKKDDTQQVAGKESIINSNTPQKNKSNTSIKSVDKLPHLLKNNIPPTIPTVRETEPIPTVRETEPIPTVRETEPIPTVRETEPIPTVRETEPIPTVRETEPIPTVRETEPIPTVRETEAISSSFIDDLAKTIDQKGEPTKQNQ